MPGRYTLLSVKQTDSGPTTTYVSEGKVTMALPKWF